MAVARAQAAENLDDAMDGLSYEIRGTYLEDSAWMLCGKTSAGSLKTARITCWHGAAASIYSSGFIRTFF